MVFSLAAAKDAVKSPQSFVELVEIINKVGEVSFCIFEISEQGQGPFASLDEGRYRGYQPDG